MRVLFAVCEKRGRGLKKQKKEKFETVFFCEKSAEESRFFAFLSQKADRKTEKKVAETKKIP